MDRFVRWTRDHLVILVFTVLKLAIQLASATNYGLHRDAYLYLQQSEHLDWGYFSTPPLLAFITRIHMIVWGDSVLAIRLLPALAGALGIFLVGTVIRQMKGGWLAQVCGLTAYLLSPAFLRPAALLQPVIFNHLFWLLAALVVLRMVRRQDPAQVLWMIPVLALGWLNKYSIVFYGLALLTALVISRNRKLLWSWHLPVAFAGGLILILPNLIWQYQHQWPVFAHMAELQETQLGNVLLSDFLVAQVFMHLPALPVWAGGLVFLVFNRRQRSYRVFAWAFGLTLLLIILLRGKFYYTIAAYTLLVVFGGLAWEHWCRKRARWVPYLVLSFVITNGIFVLPFSLPVYKPSRMVEYDRKMIDRRLDVLLKWEDGQVHELPQDYADMIGWDELGKKVWAFYNTLPDTVRETTWVYGQSYGAAGAAAYFRPGPEYPEVYSFNDAFMEWIPRSPEYEHLIYIGNSDRISMYADTVILVGEVENPYFREYGLPIYFAGHPTAKLREDWESAWLETAGRFRRNP
jgi:hypothetical protein